jgi:hypothetical protein
MRSGARASIFDLACLPRIFRRPQNCRNSLIVIRFEFCGIYSTINKNKRSATARKQPGTASKTAAAPDFWTAG